MAFNARKKKLYNDVEIQNEEAETAENCEEVFDNSLNNKCMKKNKGIFWGLLLVALGLLWLGRTFDLFHFSWCNVFKLWPLLIIWIGVTLLPIEQIWKNVCNFVLLAIAIILLFVLPARTCCRHHWWEDKYVIKKKITDKECAVNEDNEEEDVDIDNDDSITVSVNDGVITINRETEKDGEKKITVKKIKL